MFAAVRLSLSFLTRSQRIRYFVLVGARALSGFLDVFGIALIGILAGIAAAQVDQSGGPAVVLGIQLPQLDQGSLVVLVLFILAVFVVKSIIAISLSRALTSFIAHVEGENGVRIAEVLLRGSLDSAKKYSKAELQWAITGSTTYAFTGLLNNLATIVTDGFLLILVTAAFFVVDPVAALFALAYFGGIIVIIQFVIGGSLKRAGVDVVQGTVDTTNSINDTLDTFREISVLAKQPLFLERVSYSRRRVARSDGTLTFLAGMPRYVVETALILGVVIFVGVQFLSGNLASSLVTVGVFLTGGVRIMGSVLPVQTALSQVKSNVERASLAQSLLVVAGQVEADERAEDDSPVAARPITPAKGGLPISLRSVTFRYPEDDHDTLHDIDLEIDSGQHIAIIGPSGAGKTTLVDLILGLVMPATGDVEIAGIPPRELRKIAPGAVAYVPQKPGLVTGSLAENIALGVRPDDIDYARMAKVVDSAHLTEFIDSLPDGLATSVGAQADSLSGGQIQRLGLARALYSQPRLLILDEATSGLDAGSEAFVSSSLTTLGKGTTVIVIAHRLSTVQHSDVVHVVESGRITASGRFTELRKSVPMVAEYVKLMSFDED